MPIGQVTRGTTGTNRLRRVDRWIAQLPALRRAEAPLVVDLGYGASATPLFLALLLLHMLCYMPTVGLATATAFHLLKNKEREFPLVRVCGSRSAGSRSPETGRP